MQPFDEFFEPDGSPREHQRVLAKYLAAGAVEQREAIERAVRTRLREQEVSFNILGSPDGSDRPWQLDELPHVIPSEEFEQLSRKIELRAQLLAACLDDFYGPQRLLRTGVVPADVVQQNPHFFRSLHGWDPIGSARLIYYAADLVKGSSGTYFVQSDRTAAPTGSGYALENRLAIGQILATPFRDYRVRKVNRYFEQARSTLANLAHTRAQVPRVVVLTPGVEDESSFEHGYLARYQGFELVEGRDLTVRGDDVFLKTLEGLKHVDVIWRRLHDDWCDPLELREDSLLGVTGLVQAARAGKVAVANPLGSGLIESPLFRAYLPRMARAVLGTDLALPSIETRHLGDREHFAEVLSSFDDWIIRPAYGDRRVSAALVGKVSREERNALEAKVRSNPAEFVAERWPEASRVPVGLDLGRNGALSLRMFAVRSDGGYLVMPGGLGRVDDTPDGLFLYVGDASSSKDVWVVGDRNAVQPEPPRMPEVVLGIKRGGINLPSRLFDDIYWLGRYAERTNGSTRLIREALGPIASEGREVPEGLADALLETMVALQILSPVATRPGNIERILLGAIYDTSRDNSIVSCLERIHGLTTASRSRLSRDAWTVLRRITTAYSTTTKSKRDVAPEEALERLNDLLIYLAAFHGIVGSNMVRAESWVFLELGRRLEHAVFVLTLLAQLFPRDGARAPMEAILRVSDSLLTYRARYLSSLQAAPVVDLVLTDATNPQSVLFQVRRLLECVRTLPSESPFPLSRAEQRLVQLEARLVTADLYRACRGDAGDLRDLAEEGINLLWQVSDDLTQTYFTHAQRPQTMRAQALGLPPERSRDEEDGSPEGPEGDAVVAARQQMPTPSTPYVAPVEPPPYESRSRSSGGADP